MEGATKVIDWIGKATLSKLFWSFALLVYAFLLCEQFTNHFQLTRLSKAVTVMESVEGSEAYPALRAQIEAETLRVVLPQPASPWWLRSVCGAAPFVLILIAHLFSNLDWWNFGKIFLLACLAGGLVALIPDFLPCWRDCLGASLIYVLGVAFSIEDALHVPLDKMEGS